MDEYIRGKVEACDNLDELKNCLNALNYKDVNTFLKNDNSLPNFGPEPNLTDEQAEDIFSWDNHRLLKRGYEWKTIPIPALGKE